MFKLRAKGLAMSMQQPLKRMVKLNICFFFSLLLHLEVGGVGVIILIFSAFSWLESGISTCVFVRA